MNRIDPTQSWIRPMRRFLQATGRDARRAISSPRMVQPPPRWYRHLGAILVVLALVQAVRSVDRALAPAGGSRPGLAEIGLPDALAWHAWSARMGLPVSEAGGGFWTAPASGGGRIGVFPEPGAVAVASVAGWTVESDADWLPWGRLGGDSRGHRFEKIQVTGYSSRPCETDSTPTLTASGTVTQIGTVALSRDLLRSFSADAPFDFGDKVLIPGLGVFEVRDTMHPRWTRKADIWFDSTERALRFGRRAAFITGVQESAPTLADRLP